MAITKVDGQTLTAGAAGALTRAGGNTVEGTTTSTSYATVLTTSGLSIAVGTPVRVVAVLRKSAGAAVGARAHFKLNTTQVSTGHDQAWSSTVDQAESGYWRVEFIYGVATYLRGGSMESFAGLGGGFYKSQGFDAADMPVVTLTDIIIQGSVGNALVTMGADEMHVYTYAVS